MNTPMTLRLSDEEHQRLERRAEADGISMQKAAKIAIREYLQKKPTDSGEEQ